MRRRKRRKQRKIIIISSLTLLFIMTVGYAAFQTNINITAKGNILEKGITINDLKKLTVTSGDGLYKDTYETGRYVYKGANPNNYITFNNELWRIISVESDNTLKIMKKDKLSNRYFDSHGYRDSTSNGAGGTYCAQDSCGCNAWMASDNFVNGSKSGTVLKDAELNTYLNDNIVGAKSYYNILTDTAKGLIQKHTWGIGAVKYNNTDLAAQIASENSIIWTGNVGLISISDFLRANTNTTNCGNFSLNNANYSTCKTTNYLVSASGYYLAISPYASNTCAMFLIGSGGNVSDDGAGSGMRGVLPVVYLTSNIILKGQGTETNPYIIN